MDEEEREDEEYDQELYAEHADGQNEMHGDESEYGDEEVQQNYSYQDPVQEVATEDEQTSQDERQQRTGSGDDDELHEGHPVYQQ